MSFILFVLGPVITLRRGTVPLSEECCNVRSSLFLGYIHERQLKNVNKWILFVVVYLFLFWCLAYLHCCLFVLLQGCITNAKNVNTNVQMVVIINLTKNTKRPFFHYTLNKFIKHIFAVLNLQCVIQTLLKT